MGNCTSTGISTGTDAPLQMPLRFADSLEALKDAGRRLVEGKRIVPLSMLHFNSQKFVLCAAVLPPLVPARDGGFARPVVTPVDVLRLAAVKMVGERSGYSAANLIAALRGEAEMLASLHDSPRVAHALAYMEGANAKGPWAALLTEYAEGGDLTKTRFMAKLSASTVHRLTCQLCDVLEHPQLSKHRDLTASNVVLCVDRETQVQLKVVDWEPASASSECAPLRAVDACQLDAAAAVGAQALLWTSGVRATVATLLALLDPSTLLIADGSGGGNALRAVMERPAATLSDFAKDLRNVELADARPTPDDVVETSTSTTLKSEEALIENVCATALFLLRPFTFTLEGSPAPQALALLRWSSDELNLAVPTVRGGVVVADGGQFNSLELAYIFCLREMPPAGPSPLSIPFSDGGDFPDNVDVWVENYFKKLIADVKDRMARAAHRENRRRGANRRARLLRVCRRYSKEEHLLAMNARGKLDRQTMIWLLQSDCGYEPPTPQSAALQRWLEAARDDTVQQLMLWMLFRVELTEVCALLELDAASVAATPMREVSSCLTTWLNSEDIVTAVADLLAAVWEAEVAKTQGTTTTVHDGAALPPRVTWTRERHAALVRDFTEGALWALAVPGASYRGVTLPCGAVVPNTASFATDFTRGACGPPTATVMQCRMALTAAHEFGNYARVRALGPRTPPMEPGLDVLQPRTEAEAGLAMERALVHGGVWPDTEEDAARMLACDSVRAILARGCGEGRESSKGAPRRSVTFVTPTAAEEIIPIEEPLTNSLPC